MNRLDAMRDRLPPVLNTEEGTILRSVLALIAGKLAEFDEDMDRVRRSHWVDTAFDMVDLVKIGALFQVLPADWETESLYRARLKAVVAARLRGAVTRDVLEFVLLVILEGARTALGSRYGDLPVAAGTGTPVFHTGPDGPADRPAFIEFPVRRRRPVSLADGAAAVRPLTKIPLQNHGLFPAPLRGAIRGMAGGRTLVPLIANLTNGDVLVYRGGIACGQTLLMGVAADGGLIATLDGADVTADMISARGFVPGEPFTPLAPDPDPRPVMLEHGENSLWVFPLALFDAPSLGSAVLGMPSADTGHGRWAGGDAETPPFGKALFEQPPAMSLDLFWDERAPATFRFMIPAGIVRRPTGSATDAATERDRLIGLMQQTVAGLRAAGVDGQVLARPLSETQRQADRVRVLDPTRFRDTQLQDVRLTALSALFDLSATDGARFE